ncbi:glycosyltransferase family 4 protein [Rhodopirellula halodulae]|uniref:glycosyltransferase family 4 protein n=1 Tax=Rhodopirellula halodulae TaxID=2894198 RepID=UPI001E29D369|nr:glycosyltransferase family 4 protein [Rhodopirellula sp. JC737]MCC9655759.1 glycosyltransferase family 4 protein [Rhodopirellula sp. JC737]
MQASTDNAFPTAVPSPVPSISGMEPSAVAPAAPVTHVTATGSSPELRAIRVLHLVNGEHFSGAERVQSHLGRCLPELNVTADFACVKPGRFADMLEERQSGIPGETWGQCHRVPMRNRLDWTAAKRLCRVIAEGEYELLHAHTPRTAMLASMASRWSGKPWVYHVHSPAGRDCERAWANRINAWIERRSLNNCSHLITVSNSLREDTIQQGFGADQVTVVHNGVPAIHPPHHSIPSVGSRWTIGMIALMRPRKGLEVVLDSLAELRRRGTEVTLRCIGPFETDDYRQQIDSQISDLGVGDLINWVGFTEDVPSELARLDAMVLPSLYGEGLPMVVLEAMAAGTPIIATSVEGTPEAIRHGKEGLLANPRDPISLAEQIEALVTGQYDWQSMSDLAVTRHHQYFSDHTMANGVAGVYRRLLDTSDARDEA